MKLSNKTIIITGASSGIGRELALQLAPKNNALVLAARRKEKLDDLVTEVRSRGSRAIAVQADVSKESDVQRVVSETVTSFGRLDVMVNNAGVSLAQGTFMENDPEDVRKTMEINFMGCVYGARAAIPVMEKGGGGVLAFVSSIVGKRGIPRNAIYCASKFAVNGFVESLRPEIRKKNIRTVTICPAGVATPFFEVNGKGDLRKYPLHAPSKIAKRIIRALEKEKRQALLTMDARLLNWLSFFTPGILDRLLERVKRG